MTGVKVNIPIKTILQSGAWKYRIMLRLNICRLSDFAILVTQRLIKFFDVFGICESFITFFLKLGIDYSVYAFTNIINTSILYKKFPSRWKSALVKPLPKNNIPRCASDYRPISLLPAFSKVVEKLFAKQMIEYLKDTNYFDKLQSAYKQNHST